MNLKTYFKPLLEYWWLLFSAAIVAMSTTFLVTYSQLSMYQTRTTLVVGNMMYEANPSGNDIYLAQQLANYYARIGMQGELRNSTKSALGLNQLPQYTINPLPNSQFIEIVVNDSNPERAQAVANELATQLINISPTSNQQQGADQQAFINQQASYLEEGIRETLTEIELAEKNLSETNSAQKIAEIQGEIVALQAKLSQMQSNYAALISNTEQGAINTLLIIESAPLPTTPVGPSKLVMILIAGLIATVIAAAAAYILEFLDDTIRTPEEIKQSLATPLLGTIPKIKNRVKRSELAETQQNGSLANRFPILFEAQKKSNNSINEKEGNVFNYASEFPQSALAEEFRILRINLDFISKDKPLKSILITSPSPSEGKSIIASNLAIVMAQGGKKVVLLDTNFHKPKEFSESDTSGKKGLSDVLNGTLNVSDVIQPWKENLRFISPGSFPSNQSDLYNSQEMSQILETLELISDVVIIDGPSLKFTSSLALSAKVDGVLVILQYAFTRRQTAKKQLEKLTKVGAKVMGVILNNIPARKIASYFD